MDTTSEYGAPLSNLPPLAWLSGLNSGGGSEAGAMSGDQQPSLGGGAPGTQMPGMEGGLGLDALSELLKAQQGGDGEQPGAPGSMFQGIGGTVGQGTLAQGGPGYTIGGGGPMGQPGQSMGQGGYTAGQTQGNTDPMAIIRQALGVAGKAAGAFGQSGGGYESTPAESTSQLGDMGQINPSGYSLTGAGAPPPGSPEALTQFFQGELGSSMLNDPTIMQLYTSGKLNGLFGDSNANTLQDFGTGGYSLSGQSPENIFSAPGGSAGFSLGGDNTLNSSLGTSGPGSDPLGGGIGLLSGLMSLYQGGQSGNVGSLLGGAGGVLGGANQLFPGMGMGAGGSALGTIGGAVNTPAIAFGLANAIDKGDAVGIAQGLAALYGTTVPLINAVFGTALPTLTSVAGSALSSLGAGVGGAVGSGIGGVGSFLGGAAGGAAAGASTGAATGAGAAGGAAAGATAAMAPLAMIVGPYIVAQIIQMIQAGQDTSNINALMHRMQGFQTDLPNQISDTQRFAQLASEVNPGTDPAYANELLKSLIQRSHDFRESGAENILQSGFSRVQGEGRDFSAEFPQGPELYAKLLPFLQMQEAGKLRSLDVLGGAGMQLPTNWMSGETVTDRGPGAPNWIPTVHDSLDPYQFANRFAPGAFLQALMSGAPTGSPYMDVSAGSEGGGMMTVENPDYVPMDDPRYDMRNPYSNASGFEPGAAGQYVNSALYNQLMGIQPGNLEAGMANLFAPYGGFNDVGQRLGLGAQRPAQQPAQPQQVQQPIPDLTGLLALLGGQSGAWGGQDEELKRMMFANYGMA